MAILKAKSEVLKHSGLTSTHCTMYLGVLTCLDAKLVDFLLQLFGDVCFECNKAIVGDGKLTIMSSQVKVPCPYISLIPFVQFSLISQIIFCSGKCSS